MSNEENLMKGDNAANGTGKGAARKGAYRTPTLVEYGSVRQLTGNNSGPNTGDAMAMMSTASERALKENIARIGEHPSGYGLYLFDYKPQYRASCGQGRQFGVMADEVERFVPSAVSWHPNGYRVVNYAILGINKTRH